MTRIPEFCPQCNAKTQWTHLTPPNPGVVYGCTKCSWGGWRSTAPVSPESSIRPTELSHLCWQMINELRDANKSYFVDQMPEEMVKVYEICDEMEKWLIEHKG